MNGWGVLPFAQRQGLRILTKAGSRAQRQGFRVDMRRPAESQVLRLGVLGCLAFSPTRLNGWGVLPFAQRHGLRILTKTGSRAQRQGFRVVIRRPAESQALRLRVSGV